MVTCSRNYYNAINRDGNEQQYVFTNCGQTGRFGPSQSS